MGEPVQLCDPEAFPKDVCAGMYVHQASPGCTGRTSSRTGREEGHKT